MINSLKYVILISIVSFYFFSCSSNHNAIDISSGSSTKDTIDVISVSTNDSIPPPDFVEVATQPQPINPTGPTFPEDLKRSGVNATVWVKLWITKTGDVRRAFVLQTDNQIFNRAALETAISWRFSPAVDYKGNHRDVWVAIPFIFRSH